MALDVSASGDHAAGSWAGGVGNFLVQAGSFVGTIKLQFSVDGGSTYVDVGTNTQFTANGAANFELPRCKLRVNSSDTSTSAFAYITAIENRA